VKKESVFIIFVFIFTGAPKAQQLDTFYLPYPISYQDTIIYKRIIEFDKVDSTYKRNRKYLIYGIAIRISTYLLFRPKEF
jgi:hypothetical protein